MKTSEQINEIAEALAKAQGAMHGALKDSANPFFKSKYADLASVYAACKDQLSVNGISVVQSPESTDDCVVTIVETLLMHKSGQWIKGELRMMPVKNDPQGVGSCITYARRYALAAMVGVAPEDDDGNAASRHSHTPAASHMATEKALMQDGVSRAEPSTRMPNEVKEGPKKRSYTPAKASSDAGVVQDHPIDVGQDGPTRWEDFVIPFGEHKSKKLSQVPKDYLSYLFSTFKEDPRLPEQVFLKQGLILWFKSESHKETSK